MGSDKYERQSGRKRKPIDGRYSGSDERRAEFINLELDAKHKPEFHAFRKDLESVNLVFTEMLEDGYKLSCSYDNRNECLAAYAFPSDEHDNAGYILTGRGGTALSALAELLYKHSVLMDRNWPAFAERSRRRYSDED